MSSTIKCGLLTLTYIILVSLV